MGTKYIGLTIGPLYKTMTRVKATRELWASSYIFSYIMKKMIERLKANGKNFIIPFTDTPEIFNPGQEVGLFHDRFIFKASESDFKRVENIKNDVIEELAKNIASVTNEKQDEVIRFLQKYFQFYFCEIEESNEFKVVNEKVNNYLDSLELQTKFVKKVDKDYLIKFFDRVNKSFLIKDAFGEKRHSFPSIPEIAALKYEKDSDKKDLDWSGIQIKFKKDRQNDTDDTDIYEQLKKINGEKLKKYHKYIAIIQCDGDSLGDAIKSLNSNEEFGNLSKNLFDFAKVSHEEIKRYGGVTIFAGGDDLLFFAPVVSQGRTIFELVDSLAEKYNNKFENLGLNLTLSSGISITYYKYPLGEALESATNLLFRRAKNFPDKNAVAYDVQLHSGQSFSGIFSRSDEDYQVFKDLIFSKDDEKMLTSLIHKIANHSAVIDQIGADQTKTKNYFTNFFNEEEHKKYQKLINTTANLVNAIYNNPKRKQDKKEVIISVLRLKKFLEGGE